MTKTAPPAKGRRQSKKFASIESRTDRLALSQRKHRGDTAERFAQIEGWILDLMLYLDIDVQELIEVIRKEEST